MSARVYFMKRVKDCNGVSIMSPTTYNINKLNVSIVDETLTDYCFLGRYDYTKSRNYLKRRYQIRH